jgi:hypothetical protein
MLARQKIFLKHLLSTIERRVLSTIEPGTNIAAGRQGAT